MYEGLRLTELHEEWAWSCEAARRWAGLDEGEAHAQQRDRFDAEIRARVAAQIAQTPSGAQVFLGPLPDFVSDARRFYPAKQRGTLGFNHWSHHSAHYLPVEGCHLCREGRR